MATLSKHHEILTAIAALLNNDEDLEHREFSVRKKPYGRGKKWQAGGFVCPHRVQRKFHETGRNEVIYGALIVVVDPADGDLVEGLSTHLSQIERIENIFQGHSHHQIPATLIALNNVRGRIEKTDCTSGLRVVDGAFEAGFDASSCIVNVSTTMTRYVSSTL
jgi:hypothetical protein